MFSSTKFKAAFCLVVSIFLTLSSVSLGAVGVASAKSQPNADFSSLQSCLDVQGASLNVVYLMDISKSMEKSDPKKVRATMLASSLQLFYQVSKDSKKPLNFTFVSFGSTNDTAVTIPWNPVNSSNISLQIAKARRAASQESSYGTDWNEGLLLAQGQIKQKRNLDSKSCFVFSWMTDGQIDLNPNGGSTDFVPANRVAYENICNQNEGLINWFRRPSNQIATLGALLSQNANLLPTQFDDLSMEQKSVALFRPVIEGNGPIPGNVAKAYGIPKGSYECGRVTESSNLGTLVSSGQAKDLAWQFLDLVAHLRNLNKAEFEQSDGTYKLQIENSVGRLEVFTKGKNSGKVLQIKDAKGTDICSMAIKCRRTSNSNWTEWIVDIPGQGVSPGSWVIEIDSDTPAKIFLGTQGDPKEVKFAFYPEPSLQNIVEGTTVETTAKLIHEDGSDVSASEFKRICVELTKPLTTKESTCVDGSVSVPIKFNAEMSNEALQVTAKYTFSSSQEQGQVTEVRTMVVKPNSQFAKLSCPTLETDENGSEVCRLNPIPNSHQKSTTELTATVGQGQSTLEITGFKADDSEDRVDAYNTDGTPYGEITVTAENPQSIPFILANSKIKIGVDDVHGIIAYAVRDGAGQEVISQLKVVFDIESKKNGWILVGFYLLALIIGLGIPYILLIFAAKSAGTFAATSFRYMTVPIEISNEGIVRSRVVGHNGDGENDQGFGEERVDQPFALPDARELSNYVDVPQGSKQISIGSATISIIQKALNPFAPIKVELFNPSSLVYSNRGESIAIETGIADQSLVGLYFITASLDELEPIADESPSEKSFDFDDTAFDAFESNKLAVRQDGLIGQLTCVVVGEVNPRTQLQRFVEDLQTSDESFKNMLGDLQELRSNALERRKVESQIPKVGPAEGGNQDGNWNDKPSFEGDSDIPQPNFE